MSTPLGDSRDRTMENRDRFSIAYVGDARRDREHVRSTKDRSPDLYLFFSFFSSLRERRCLARYYLGTQTNNRLYPSRTRAGPPITRVIHSERMLSSDWPVITATSGAYLSCKFFFEEKARFGLQPCDKRARAPRGRMKNVAQGKRKKDYTTSA